MNTIHLSAHVRLGNQPLRNKTVPSVAQFSKQYRPTGQADQVTIRFGQHNRDVKVFRRLVQAIENNDKVRAEKLLQQWGDPNQIPEGEQSLLMPAVEYMHADMVELLLKANANPNWQDEYRMTILDWFYEHASAHRDNAGEDAEPAIDKMNSLLQAYGAKSRDELPKPESSKRPSPQKSPSLKTGTQPELFRAVRRADIGEFKQLIRSDRVNLQEPVENDWDRTALMVAIWDNQDGVFAKPKMNKIKAILEVSTNVNQLDKDGQTALDYAYRYLEGYTLTQNKRALDAAQKVVDLLKAKGAKRGHEIE